MNKIRTGDLKIATFDYKQKQDKLIAKLFTRYPILVNLWARHSKFVEFSDSPWTQMTMAASQCHLALVTTSGVHLLSQPPFNMKDPAGDPTFREIPADTFPKDLGITHDYYDHTDADRDINVVFPIERVLDLKKLGDIGDVNRRHFSFMGHITNQHVHSNKLLRRYSAMEKRSFSIPKISCGHCVMTIKNELIELVGVKQVEGDTQNKTITVEWESPTTLQEIQDTLIKINYPAS